MKRKTPNLIIFRSRFEERVDEQSLSQLHDITAKIEKKKFEIMIPEITYMQNRTSEYQPIFKQPQNFLKGKESVFEDGHQGFTFNEINYEITEKDI